MNSGPGHVNLVNDQGVSLPAWSHLYHSGQAGSLARSDGDLHCMHDVGDVHVHSHTSLIRGGWAGDRDALYTSWRIPSRFWKLTDTVLLPDVMSRATLHVCRCLGTPGRRGETRPSAPGSFVTYAMRRVQHTGMVCTALPRRSRAPGAVLCRSSCMPQSCTPTPITGHPCHLSCCQYITSFSSLALSPWFLLLCRS